LAKRTKDTTRTPSASRLAVAAPPADPVGGPNLPVVAVGASAGGLEAFSQLLDALPPELGMAFVLVSHLSPQHQSAMAALLTPHTAMPVAQVSEGVRLEPDHVYVIPPDRRLSIEGRHLHLQKRPDDRSQYTPIDGFFSSLAIAAGSRAIGVVLSGTASDGALGIREIKAAGGITLAQAPASAKYDGMPKAAIATGMVDVVQPPHALAATLAEIARHSYARPARRDHAEELAVGDDQLQRIFELLKPVSGVDFGQYKLPTIKRRLLRRMALNRVHDVAHYLRALEESPAEVRALYQDLLIHVTRFFRDPEAFQSLATLVFPKLLSGPATDRPYRAWVSGCATGEEAYSLAIEWLEYCRRNKVDRRMQIFATDVSENAIDHARAGLYAAAITADVPADRLRRYFTRIDGSYRVVRAVRDLVVFARQDLTRDPPFSRLDLVLCRNVLIYLEAALQRRLISMFHYALNPQGYLMLGQAETVGTQLGLFALVDKKSRLHRKKAAGNTPAASRPAPFAGVALRPKTAAEPIAADVALQGEVNRVIFDRYAPPGVVVDDDLQVTQFRGQTGMFLEPAPGEPSLNVLKMLREGLLHGVRAALQTARRTRESVRKEGLEVRTDHGWKKVAIETVPLVVAGRTHYLILFEPAEQGKPRRPTKADHLKPKSAREQRSQLDLLQRELAASREYLQSIIQELEAANEELQSANEEILSSNEELQSTNEELDTAKEELQSTNEELNTVNEELHGRNEELTKVNSDLVNLIASVHIAIVIVGRDLRIRRFTPMAEKLLNLIPGDVDRSITHINTNLDCSDLEALIVQTMDEVTQVERDIQARDGRWFSLRIRPYKDLNNKIDGAVLALFDIDLLKRGSE